MKNLIGLIIIILLILIQGCSSGPEVLIHRDFTGDGIAVLNFKSEGSFLASNIGGKIADKLTEALFLNGEFRVIDRATLNNTIVQMGIKSSEILSSEVILQLGERIKANYIVLGRVEQISNEKFVTMDNDVKFNITFRILSTSNSEIIGMVSYSVYDSNNIITELDFVLEEMVKSM